MAGLAFNESLTCFTYLQGNLDNDMCGRKNGIHCHLRVYYNHSLLASTYTILPIHLLQCGTKWWIYICFSQWGSLPPFKYYLIWNSLLWVSKNCLQNADLCLLKMYNLMQEDSYFNIHTSEYMPLVILSLKTVKHPSGPRHSPASQKKCFYSTYNVCQFLEEDFINIRY